MHHLSSYQIPEHRRPWDAVHARFLLFNTRECGEEFASDIRINRQLPCDQDSALQVQRWTGRIIWS